MTTPPAQDALEPAPPSGQPASASPELAALAPDDGEYTLASGTQVKIKPLKTRELFRLLKIVTTGGGMYMSQMDLFGAVTDPQVFAGRFTAIVIMAIPQAENEAMEFIRSMVEPYGLVQPARDKAQQLRNQSLYSDLDQELFNPELEDTFGIIEQIVKRESGNIASLGKRLSSMFTLAQRTGQVPSQPQSSSSSPSISAASQPPSTQTTSSEALPASSTSSAPSTDGVTSGYSTSPSPA